MEIIQVKIDELKPASYNPRRLTVDQHKHLTESLEKFGMVDPIICNKHIGRENIIVGGHMRWMVAKELKYETVPVFYVDLDEAKEKELNVRLNKNVGEFNYDLLANNFEIESLKDIGFTDMELGLIEKPKEGMVSLSFRVPESSVTDTIAKIKVMIGDEKMKIWTRKV